MLFAALFVFELGFVFAALGASALYFRWLDERRTHAKLDRIRNVNLSWQSSPTARNQST
jgi:hypothetical protein